MKKKVLPIKQATTGHAHEGSDESEKKKKQHTHTYTHTHTDIIFPMYLNEEIVWCKAARITVTSTLGRWGRTKKVFLFWLFSLKLLWYML